MRRLVLLFLYSSTTVVIPFAVNAQCAGTVQQQIVDRQYHEAEAVMHARLRIAPADDSAIDCMGRVLLARGKSGAAVDWLERAIKINGASAYHHEALGNALLEEAMKGSAFRRPFIIRRLRKEFEIAVSLDSTLVDARRGLVMFYSMAPPAMGGSMSKAREHAEAIMKVNPMRGHMASGAIAERNNDNVIAEREFRAAISVHPDSIAPYGAAGAFYRRHRRLIDAIEMYRKVVALDPDNGDAKNVLALLMGVRE